jgi:hypothetical protein
MRWCGDEGERHAMVFELEMAHRLHVQGCNFRLPSINSISVNFQSDENENPSPQSNRPFFEPALCKHAVGGRIQRTTNVAGLPLLDAGHFP